MRRRRTTTFVHDLFTGATERVSVDSAGGEADGQSVGPRRVPEPARVPGHLRARTVNGRGGIAPAPLEPSQALC
jgi:hypothetical protein